MASDWGIITCLHKGNLALDGKGMVKFIVDWVHGLPVKFLPFPR